MGGPGIRTFISYQINFKRITIAPEDKKEASCIDPKKGRMSPKDRLQSRANHPHPTRISLNLV